MPGVLVLGLTGGIGSGKSTVARMLAERGCHIVDADALAREVVEPGEPALGELVERFGRDILRADGSLDRPGLARLAFADEAARGDLDRITHPRIAAKIAEAVARVAAEESPDEPAVVVVDHPLLVETGQAARFDAVVVVTADESERVRRLEARGMDREDALRRIAAQVSDAQRVDVATHVVANDAGLDELVPQVDALVGALDRAARERGV